jgi:hypothetical protein
MAVVITMATAESESKTHHWRCINRPDINRGRIDDRGCLIDHRGLLHNHRLLDNDLLRSGRDHLRRLLHHDLLRLLINHLGGLLHHHWCWRHINRMRPHRFRNDNSCADSPDHPGGDCAPAVRLRARDARAEQSHCCHCYQGLFHTFSFVLLAWTESMLDYSGAGGTARIRDSYE